MCIVKGTRILPPQSCPFWDIGFKLIIQKQKIQKEPVAFLLSCLRDSDEKACSRREIATPSP